MSATANANKEVVVTTNERPRSSHGAAPNHITQRLDLLYPEADLSPKLVRIEELLKYCEEVGLDDKCLKFTEPEYYLEHVLVSAYDNEKIKEMMHSVDHRAVKSY